jgi:sterol 3beta-glucosyltransferase
MRIAILALGSRGDVQPYIALSRGLQDAGHRVRMVSFENFRTAAEDQGLAFLPVKGNAQTLMNSAAGAQMMESNRNPFTTMRTIMQTFGRLMNDYIEAFSSDALRDSEAIIDQLPASLFGYDLAEKLGVPHLIASVIPLEPTRTFPLVLLTNRSRGARLNQLTYRFAEQLVWQSFRRGVNRFRRQLGLPPAGISGPFGAIRKRRDLIINGFSRHVVPPPGDWGSHVHTTGYWILPERSWQPSRELLSFLDTGKPPVFIGFGSMPVRNPALLTEQLMAALRLSGERAVILRGWADIGHEGNTGTTPDVFWLDFAPYEWLFPRMAALVHHGGSGTTGAGLRAGVPSVVVPFGADQHFWGSRVTALGAGPEPIPFKTLTGEKLAQALHGAANDAHMRQCAAQLGKELAAEDGVSTAVEIITRHLSPRNPLFGEQREQ